MVMNFLCQVTELNEVCKRDRGFVRVERGETRRLHLERVATVGNGDDDDRWATLVYSSETDI